MATPLVLAVVLCVLIEVLVGFGLWLALGHDGGETVSAVARPTAVVGARALPTAVPVARTSLDLAYPTLVPRPTAAPPVATQVPDADQVWSSLTPELDTASAVDTPRAVQMLDDFVARFPDYAPAREKLYSVLLAYGANLQQAGDPQAAAEELLKAQAVLPDRGEAGDALLALTAPDAVPPVASVGADTSDPGTQVAVVPEPDQASEAASDAEDPSSPAQVAAEQPPSQPQAVAEEPPVRAALLRAAPPTPEPQPVNSQPQRATSSSRPAANPAPVVVRPAPPPAPPAAPPTPTKAPFVAPVHP